MRNEAGSDRGGATTGARLIVFGDIHGDLDTLARSLAERGLVRYDGDLESLVVPIRKRLSESFSPELEALVVEQPVRTRLVLIGDLVDRFPYGYHVLQFLSKVRWERFDIELIRILGNHDLMNFMFFANPFEVHQLMSEAGRPKEEIMQYIGSMGLADSLHSFYDLHHEELLALQEQFYREGEISFREGSLTRSWTYPVDLEWLGDTPHLRLAPARRQGRPEIDPVFRADDLAAYATGLLDRCGRDLFDEPPTLPTTLNALVQFVFDLLGELMERAGERNWWRVFLRDSGHWFGYSPEINGFNAFVTEFPEGTYQLVPIDWRLVSLVWRKHYGPAFRQTRVLHVQGDTLFLHGGLSPLAMLDPLFFGALYSPTSDTFRDISALSQVSLDAFVDRTNRLAGQVMENALNDYSFARMAGVELLDQMGSWRGSSEGLPEFGGPLWSDFEFLKAHLEAAHQVRLKQLYEEFARATGLKRVVCGHTVFISWTDPGLRYQKIDAMEPLGLEYICVDNGCSRAYRWHEPVPTGIEFDEAGNILLDRLAPGDATADFGEGTHGDRPPGTGEGDETPSPGEDERDADASGERPAMDEVAGAGREEDGGQGGDIVPVSATGERPEPSPSGTRGDGRDRSDEPAASPEPKRDASSGRASDR